MRISTLAALLLAGLASPAFAAGDAAKYYVVVDTVGNCSVIEGRVSTGKTAIGEEDGYTSKDAAVKALEEVAKDENTCQGIVG